MGVKSPKLSPSPFSPPIKGGQFKRMPFITALKGGAFWHIVLKVWFGPDVAGYTKEKIWHESQQIEEEDDASVILEAEVAGTDEIQFWIISWGSHALVLEPDSLRDEIKVEAEETAERYKRTEDPSAGSGQSKHQMRR